MRAASRVVLVFGVLLGPGGLAEAQQFRTPDRQFHNQTAFPLDGRHRAVECEACHIRGVYKGTPTACFDCHWVRRQDDRYRLQLGSRCEQCHQPSSWTNVRWDHGAMTAMPLNAAHRQLECVSCHRDNVFRTTDTACASCHSDEYARTTSPDHAAAGFPMTCESCHRPGDTSFTTGVMGVDHSAVFPLVGRHVQQACVTCHVSNVYRGTPRECAGCHNDEYARTTAPNHAAAGFSMDCQSCHRPTDPSFTGATFNHNTVFALVGNHARQTCATCHVNNVYKGTSRECAGCHSDEYTRTTAPNHAAAGFSMDCQACHRATDPSFRGAGFNHNAVFALVGNHAQQTCATCHVNNVYKGTPRDCVGCHNDDYARTTTPSHAAAGFPMACESCHRASDTTWTAGTFNHRFPITSGPHKQECSACHTTSNYQVFSCLNCHEHSKARMDDKHKERAGYRYDSLACYGCHPTGRH